jgi:hypothetical protein
MLLDPEWDSPIGDADAHLTYHQWTIDAARRLKEAQARMDRIDWHRRWQGRYQAALSVSPVHGPHRR